MDSSARAREQFRRGLQFERQKHPAAAIMAYRTAVRLDPTLRDAHYRSGLLFNTRSQWAEAVKEFAAEVEHHPDHQEAARELGVALARSGDHARARQQLELLSRRAPRDGRVWHALGFVDFQAGRARDAETALRRAIALPPPQFEEHRDLGVVLAATGREKEAREQYRRALALEPNDPVTWFNLGNLEARAGRLDSALASYSRAVEQDSSLSLGYDAQVRTLRELGRESEVVAVYRAWLTHVPADHAARLQAVELLIRLGRHEEAVEWAEAGVRAAPRRGAPYMIYAMALAGRGRLRDALTQFRKGQRAFGGDHAEVQRAEDLIAALRKAAPDSLRALFAEDSLRAARERAERKDGRAGATPSRSRP
jgi:Flp pilus assembly protein TadD